MGLRPACAQTSTAGDCSDGKQDGTDNLGSADQERILPTPHRITEGEQNTRDSKTLEMMEHSQPANHDTPSNVWDISLSDKPYGTWSAETIRASGHEYRTNRPDTRLLLTSAKIVSKMSCYAGAIHTGYRVGRTARSDRAPLSINLPPCDEVQLQKNRRTFVASLSI